MNTSLWIVNLLFIPLPANLKGPRRRHYNYYCIRVCVCVYYTHGLPEQNQTTVQDTSGSCIIYNIILFQRIYIYTIHTYG